MEFSLDLLTNAIVAGLLLGGFYAAVTVGISIAFGILDIVNIAHPAFIILGSYLAYLINITFGVDPVLVSILMLPVFYALGALVYQIYYASFEKYGQESLRGLAFRRRLDARRGLRQRSAAGRPQPATRRRGARCPVPLPRGGRRHRARRRAGHRGGPR